MAIAPPPSSFGPPSLSAPVFGDATLEDSTSLATLAVAGDEEALGRLLSLHERTAYNVAYRIVGRDEDARDAVQEAFLLALRALRGDGAPPRDVERFRPWLLRIVANAALAQVRRRPRVASVPVETVDYVLSAPESLEPARVLERREARGDVLAALLALPESQRAALTLREYQELSYDEIGETLGLDRNATAQLLFRARREFRAAYEGLAAAPPSIGCPELGPLLSALTDNELDSGAWDTVTAHLERCERCRRELAGLRRARRLHGLIPLVAPPAGWHATATGGAGLAATAAILPMVAGPMMAGPMAAGPMAAAPTAGAALAALPAAIGGLLAKLAALAGAKAAGALVAVGFGAVVVAAPDGGHVLSSWQDTQSNLTVADAGASGSAFTVDRLGPDAEASAASAAPLASGPEERAPIAASAEAAAATLTGPAAPAVSTEAVATTPSRPADAEERSARPSRETSDEAAASAALITTPSEDRLAGDARTGDAPSSDASSSPTDPAEPVMATSSEPAPDSGSLEAAVVTSASDDPASDDPASDDATLSVGGPRLSGIVDRAAAASDLITRPLPVVEDRVATNRRAVVETVDVVAAPIQDAVEETLEDLEAVAESADVPEIPPVVDTDVAHVESVEEVADRVTERSAALLEVVEDAAATVPSRTVELSDTADELTDELPGQVEAAAEQIVDRVVKQAADRLPSPTVEEIAAPSLPNVSQPQPSQPSTDGLPIPGTSAGQPATSGAARAVEQGRALSESPKIELPKVDAIAPRTPAAEPPKVDSKPEPKAEAPRVEAPRVEAPKTAAPKVDAPKAEAPKVEAPKVEAPRPQPVKVEAPRAEAPKVEVPKPDVRKAEAPKVAAPKVEAPKSTLKVEAPKSAPKAPKVEAPRLSKP